MSDAPIPIHGGCSRRRFLQGGLAAAAAGGASSILTGCPTMPAPLPDSPVSTRAKVAAVLGDDLDTMARTALEAFGGAKSFIAKGDRVFIKVNLCTAGLMRTHNPILPGDSTKPDLGLAVAEECLKAGAAEVVIGDAAQVNSFSWEALPTLDGISNYAAEATHLNHNYGNRLTLACLNADSPSWTGVPSPRTAHGKLYVSSLVTDADKIISIPVIKTHRWTQVTAALKNFVGVTPISKYGLGGPWRFMLHDDSYGGIEQCFLDINHALQPVFTIIDGSICCEGNGPHVLPGFWGETVDMKERLGSYLVLASNDLAAADATVARIIGLDVSTITYLQAAYRQGLGQINEDMIDLDGATLANLRVPWKSAQPTDGFWDILIPGIVMLMS